MLADRGYRKRQRGGGSLRLRGVPKTGQTTSFYSGDDGELQRGVIWPSPRFMDWGDGTVTDNLTGLMWLKDCECLGVSAP